MTPRLHVTRSGGFAGLERSGETPLTVEEHQALLAARSSSGRLDPAPDRFLYELRWRFRGRGHRCELDERSLTPELRKLLQRALEPPS